MDALGTCNAPSHANAPDQPLSPLERKIQKDLARWYPLIDHPARDRWLTSQARFDVVCAGRRSGKTEDLKRIVSKHMMAGAPGYYFLAAPTYDQVKKVFWEDMKKLCISSALAKKPNESELTITMPGGQVLYLLGLDKPERFEGIPWIGGGITEFANIKPDAWTLNIKPALDTVDPTRPSSQLAWCVLESVPEGLNHFYDHCEYARISADPEWAFHHWKSSVVLPPEVIAAAMRTMSAKQFRQEYEASFETVAGRVYEDYSDANHTTRTLAPHEQIHWMHDFNFTPMSSAIGVRDKNVLTIVDEIILESAVARQTAEEFCDRFSKHENKNVVLYGDPSGRAGEKHGHASDYTEIETVLHANGWKLQRKVKNKAPAIRDRQNAVRAKIKNAMGDTSLFVNPGHAPYTHKGLSIVQIKEGSTFLEQESDYQHITTALGYCVDYEWPIRSEQKTTPKAPPPIAHHWR